MAWHKASSLHCTACAVQTLKGCTTQTVPCIDGALCQATRLGFSWNLQCSIPQT